LCAEDVVLEFQYGSVRPIAVDRIQLEQVVINLVSNARDAVALRGTIRLRTGSLTDEVWIAVEDDGPGIDEQVMSHLFEPFFTTKPAAKGSGLGLATVHGVVEQSGGRVDVTSRPGRGTCFRVVFPVVGEFPPARRNARRIHTPVRENISILVVDDDALVRGVVTKVLQDNGYPGAVSVDPAGAVAAAESLPRLDLLVTDVVMPNITGRELYAQIAQVHRGVRVIYCSGYADDFVASRGGMPAPGEYLPKPFTEQSLLAKVSDVLTRYPIDVDLEPPARQ
jgi:CheY-like chemotaxis protein/anti-sigma regulatory factor (Ser/Thr protein kinase)